ncbi:hypothetical protein BDZ88DRAFT_455818 [Geranomyces variabilis]|nr:hypothetical protein BDZ88DRAFT_455818 [Geranomyces variabilis]KAJ3140005.1 hypothetical protein HDU90_008908 [Geranomyces variabilis]
MSAPNFGINWRPTFEPLTPSDFFEKHLKRVENHYDAESEPLTRAFLDVYILEPARDRITLSGFGDWFMAYGERNVNVANVSLVGEAKNAGCPLGNNAVFQILTNMLIVHHARRGAGKEHPRVYGFLTNRMYWILYHIDDNGQVFASKRYDASRDPPAIILGALHHVFRHAQLTCSPATAQAAATENLKPVTGRCRKTIIQVGGTKLNVEAQAHTLRKSFVRSHDLSDSADGEDDDPDE